MAYKKGTSPANTNREQQAIEKRNIRLTTLNAISLTISSSLDLNEVLKNTVDKMLELLEPDSIRIYLLDKKQGVLHLASYRGLADKFVGKSFILTRKVGDGILGQTVLLNETRVIDNFLRSKDPYVDFIIEEGLQSSVYIPLVSKREPVGVMCVSSHSQFKFSSDYLEFLTVIGNQIGVAVDNANLYENLKKAYHELKEAQEQAIRAEKLASVGKLAATVAHEINNPLAAVLTYIRLMLKLISKGRFTPERLGDIARYLTTMESETSRCGEIVKNLLAFSRRSKGTIMSHSIEEIIDKTLVLITHDLKMKGIEVVKMIEPDLPELQCDFKQIQQAFLNLMGNASEAMEKGGTLTVACRQSERNDILEIIISDTGCGIPGKDLENIFEPFFTTKKEGEGVGLGLSIVYRIVTTHNGKIQVESELEKGSVFRIRLPILLEDRGSLRPGPFY